MTGRNEFGRSASGSTAKSNHCSDAHSLSSQPVSLGNKLFQDDNITIIPISTIMHI